jgi:hypothetical protein
LISVGAVPEPSLCFCPLLNEYNKKERKGKNNRFGYRLRLKTLLISNGQFTNGKNIGKISGKKSLPVHISDKRVK